LEIDRLKVFKLGDWVVEPSSGTLRKGEELVHLAPKVMDLLLVLVRNQGEVVTKEELISTIWPDTFVAETALTRSISELRHSLADSTGSPSYIETIPKRGYRFLVEAEEFRKPRRIRNWKIPAVAVTAMIVLAIAVLSYLYFPEKAEESSMAAPGSQNLVVLPFTSTGLNPESIELTIGVTEIIIEYLSRYESLNVASGTSLTHFEHNTKDLREIASHLGVPHLLEGSYQSTDGGTVLSLRLTDTRTRNLLWRANTIWTTVALNRWRPRFPGK